MKYNAEYVRSRVGGSYELAVKVYALIASLPAKPLEASATTWEAAIKVINKSR